MWFDTFARASSSKFQAEKKIQQTTTKITAPGREETLVCVCVCVYVRVRERMYVRMCVCVGFALKIIQVKQKQTKKPLPSTSRFSKGMKKSE